MKKILILEDNLAAMELLGNIVHELDDRNEVYTFTNVKDAYQCALEKKIDLFLIDIILDTDHPGDISGLTFVESIRHVGYYSFTPVIFITSLEDARFYTYENLHCYSFIEKPFDVEKVKQTIKQCLLFPGTQKDTKTIYFRKDGIILAVDREDIVYAESIAHIMHIHTAKGDVMHIPYITLKKLLEDVDCLEIVQCSRNTIINKKYVENVDIPNRVIQLKNGLGRVEIGVMYKKEMRECFG